MPGMEGRRGFIPVQKKAGAETVSKQTVAVPREILDADAREKEKAAQDGWNSLENLRKAKEQVEGIRKNPAEIIPRINNLSALGLTKEAFLGIGLQEVLPEAYKELVKMGDADKVSVIMRELSPYLPPIPEKKMNAAIREGAIAALQSGNMEGFAFAMDTFDLTNTFAESREVKKAAYTAVAIHLAEARFEEVTDFLQDTMSASLIYATPEIQKAIEHGAELAMQMGSFSSLEYFRDSGLIGKNKIDTMLAKSMASAAKKGEIGKALEMHDYLELPNKMLGAEELREPIIKKIAADLKNGDSLEATDLVTKLPNKKILQEERLQKAALSLLTREIDIGNMYLAATIGEHFSLPKKAVEQLVREKFKNNVRQGNTQEIEAAFPFVLDAKNDPAMQKTAAAGIADALKNGAVQSALRIQSIFSLPQEKVAQVLADPAVQQHLTAAIFGQLGRGALGKVVEIQQQFPVPKEMLEEVFMRYLTSELNSAYKNAFEVLNVAKNQGCDVAEFKKNPAVQKNMGEYIIYQFNNGGFGKAVELVKEINLPPESEITQRITRAAAHQTESLLAHGEIKDAVSVIKSFNLSMEAVPLNLERALASCIIQNNTEGFTSLVTSLAIPTGYLHTSGRIIQAAEEGFLKRYLEGAPVDFITNLGFLDTARLSQFVQDNIIRYLQRGVTPNIPINTTDAYLTDEFWKSPALIDAAQKCLLVRLSVPGKVRVNDLKGIELQETFMRSEQVAQAVQKNMELSLARGQWMLDELQQLFTVDTGALQSPGMQAALMQGIKSNLLSSGNMTPKQVIEEWLPRAGQYVYPEGIPAAAVEKIIRDTFLHKLKNGDAFLQFKDILTKETIQSQEVQDYIFSRLMVSFRGGMAVREDYFSFAQKELLTSPSLTQAAELGFMEVLARQANGGVVNKDGTAGADITYILNKYPLPNEIRRSAEMTRELFGNFFSKEQFNIVLSTQRNIPLPTEFTEKLQGTGLENLSPKELLPALKERIAQFRTSLLENNPDTDLLKLPFYRDMLRVLVRADVVKWHVNISFDEVLKGYITRTEKSGVPPTMEGYVESGPVRIKKVERDTPAYTQAFTERYGVLRADLHAAAQLVLMENKPFSILAAETAKVRDELVTALEEKIIKVENPKGKEHLYRSIEALKALNPRSVKDMEKNLAVLGNHREFDSIIRKVGFIKSLKEKGRTDFGEVTDIATRKTPTFDDINWFATFVNETTHRDTWADYFSDKQALKAFKSATSVSALTEELKRFEQHIQNNAMPVDFIPTRGLLFEYSGELADACWMAKEQGLAAKHKNKSSVTMVANRGTVNERMVGAFILIESKTKEGDEVVIIRGLNPIENFINQLSVDDFVDKAGAYVKKIAENRGKKAAIIIDGERGLAATNRQTVFNRLESMKRDLTRANLASAKDTTFNGYDVTDTTYFL